MPTPSAFGPFFAPATSGFVSSFAAGSIDVGTTEGWVTGWVNGSGGGGNVARPGVVTVGGVALTVGGLFNLNDAVPNGFGGGGGWKMRVSGFLPGQTGLQPVVVTQVDGAGAASNLGQLTVRLQAYNNVTSVPVQNAISPPANSTNISRTFASVAGRLDVLSASTSMSRVAGTPIAVTATSGTLRSESQPSSAPNGANDVILLDRPGAASAVLSASTTNSFSFSYFGAEYSLAGSAAAGPTITTQPAPQTVLAGQTATFTVVATGTGLGYAWTKNGVAAGTNAASYTTGALSAADNGHLVQVTVTDGSGSTLSNTALLTVNTPPSVTTNPVAQSVALGVTPAPFTAAFAGTAPITVQWRKNGTNIAAATALTYQPPATVAGDNGATFDCVGTNGFGSPATTTAAVLTVTGITSFGFDLSTAPYRVTSFAGSGLPLTVEVGTQAVVVARLPGNPAIVATSGPLTADAGGYFPRWTNGAFTAAGVTYELTFMPLDGRQSAIARVTTT